MIQQPIVILGAPRSGTTLLFRIFACNQRIWHLAAESHHILEGPYHPRETGRYDNRVAWENVRYDTIPKLRREFYEKTLNPSCVSPEAIRFFSGGSLLRRAVNRAMISVLGAFSKLNKPNTIRIVEKTPKNCLRLPLLRALFPDAYYVWITRHPYTCIPSLVRAWRAREEFGPFEWSRFGKSGYNINNEMQIEGVESKKWKFALVPDWDGLTNRRLVDVAAWQYFQCNHVLLNDLQRANIDRIYCIKYEHLIDNTNKVVRDLSGAVNIEYDVCMKKFVSQLPRINKTVDSGSPNQEEIEEAVSRIQGFNRLKQELGYIE